MTESRTAPAVRLGLAVLCVSALVVTTANAPARAEPAVHQINLTSDSAPGWLPRLEQENAARRSLETYLATVDGGQAAAAYAMLAPGRQQLETLAAYSAWLTAFNATAGPVKAHRVVKLTWTKDSPGAPIRGVYAAFDMVSRFARIDRHCGRIVLFQAPAGGDFQVAREEYNYLDNAGAAAIETHQSKADLDQAWLTLAAHCPNYDPAALATAGP